MTQSPAASPAAKTARAAPADAGVIEARVTYAGAPDVDVISINKDVEKCGTQARIEKILIGEDHGLVNAVVSVPGLDGPPRAGHPQIDQHGCRFRPHVVAMQPGDLEILNSDGVLHNLHTYSDTNPTVNKAQPKFKKTMTATFSHPGNVKVTCDVHSWMQGWIVVLDSPYFGPTDTRGVTRIEGVPAGHHTVEVWHETLGRRSQDVTVKPGETIKVTLAFPRTAG